MRPVDDKAYRTISKALSMALVVMMLAASGASAQSKMSQASLSPDGTTIAYTYYIDDYQSLIHLYDVKTHKDTELQIKGGGWDWVACPSFAPDSKRLLFSAGGFSVHWRTNIFIVNLDGTGLRQMTPNARDMGEWYEAYYNCAQYSRDGATILVWKTAYHDTGEGRANCSLCGMSGPKYELMVMDGKGCHQSEALIGGKIRKVRDPIPESSCMHRLRPSEAVNWLMKEGGGE